MNSHRLNRPFNDPGQTVKVRGNTPQVNIRCGGPLVAQKLLYVSYVGLLRFDQTNGKIVAYGMEPTSLCWVCPFFVEALCPRL